MRPRSIVVVTLLSLVLAPAAARGALPPLGIGVAGFRGEYVPGELLVKFKDAVSLDQRRAAIAALGHERLGTIEPGWIHVRTAPGESVEAALAAYALDSTVDWAQPNYVYRALNVPNDPLYPLMWGLHNTHQQLSQLSIPTTPTQPAGTPLQYLANNPGPAGDDMNLEKAWDHITDCSSVVVAVVDTGVSYGHLDLASNMWNGGALNPNHGKNFVAAVAGDDATLDLNGHGTHVAGTIGAVGNNSRGTVGVCWQANLMAVRVLDAFGSGTTAAIAAGVDFAVANGAKVINMSLGGSVFDQAFSDAITNAQNDDVLVVVAAGNSSSNNDVTPTYPCSFTQPNVLCVAALDQGYGLASFSNWGATSVDVGAPGTNVVSTWPGEAIGDPLDGIAHGWNNVATQGSPLPWTLKGATFDIGGFQTVVRVLANPQAFPTGTYADTADSVAWSDPYDVAGSTSVTVHFAFATDVAPGDAASFAASGNAGDPFASSAGFPLPSQTYPALSEGGVNLSCGTACTVGFRLVSDNVTQTSHGVAITGLTLQRIDPSPSSYNTESGTSMAAPMTAGVAAMIRAYNPQYTAGDVVASIKGGGRRVAALVGKTASGNAVDAMGTLAFINPPTDVAAVVR